MRKFFCLVLSLLLVTSLITVSEAESTSLEVSFLGMTLLPDGQWRNELISAIFDVYQDDVAIGKLTVNAFGSTRLTLNNGNNVILIPEVESVTNGYAVEETGYSVSVTEGMSNTAHIIAYANSGIFKIQADGVHTYRIESEETFLKEESDPFFFSDDNDFIMDVTTNDQGVYELLDPIPAGTYIIMDADSENHDRYVTFPIIAYRGNSNEITFIDMVNYTAVNEAAERMSAETAAQNEDEPAVSENTPAAAPTETPAPTAEPTAAPTDTPAPTAEPTAAPTDTPAPTTEPTAAPTDTPAPTAEPTAAPTDTPVPTAEPTAVPTEAPAPTAEPTAVPTETPAPTAKPTAVPTETPVPTAEPTDVPTETPAPTAEPTAVPTETPAPTAEPTAVPTEAPAADAAGALQENSSAQNQEELFELVVSFDYGNSNEFTVFTGDILNDDRVVYTAEISENQPDLSAKLPSGTYSIQIDLPEGVFLHQLNGFDIDMDGKLTWEVNLGRNTSQTALLQKYCTLTGRVWPPENLKRGFIENGADVYNAVISDGDFTVKSLKPAVYTITLLLSENTYTGEGWTFTADEAGTKAVCEVTIDGESRIVLPEIEMKTEGAEPVSETDSSDNAANNEEQTAVESEDESGEIPALSDDSDNMETEDGTEDTSEPTGDSESIEAENTVEDDSQSGNETELLPSSENISAYYEEMTAKLEAVKEQYPETAALLLENAEASFMIPRDIPLAEAEGNSTIEVCAFIDANHNGERGPYERPLPDTEVELIYQDAQYGEVIIGISRTDSEGMAVFSGIPDGSYRIRTTLPVYYGYGERGRNSDSLSSSIMQRQSAQLQESELITLEPGATLHVGIGGTATSSISGQVWLDTNGDGIRQEDEPGQAGILVEMEGLKNGLTYQYLTDEDGYYSFNQLRLGGYKIRATLPDGYMFTNYSKQAREDRSIFNSEGKTVATKNYDFNKVTHETEQNIGVCADSGIDGICFLDADYDGVYDEGEAFLPGVKITVYKQSNNQEVVSVTSDEQGQYSMPALRSGTYKVKAILPEGVFFSKTDEGEGGNRFRRNPGHRETILERIDLLPGMHLQMNVGAVVPASLSGAVYMDDDFSGSRNDNEKAVSGLVVSLLGPDGSVVAADRTNNNGAFIFEGIVPGTYVLSMNAPEGYAFTRFAEGNIMISRSGAYGTSEPIEVQIGGEYTGLDCGIIVPCVVEGGFFGDANDNGTWDAEEVGLSGVKMTLTGEEDAVYETSVNADGTYRFDAVLPGAYVLKAEIPESAVFISNLDSSWSVDGQTAVYSNFFLNSGEYIRIQDCGALLYGSIGGFIFSDPEGNGVFQEGYAGISGAELVLTSSKTGEALSIRTENDGAFQFTMLRPGEYTISLTLPEGQVLSRNAHFTLPLRSSKQDQKVTLSLGMGENLEDQQLGSVTPGMLSAAVWLDENGDGSRGLNERPAGDETIDVFTEDGELLLSLTSDGEGNIGPVSIIPGSYRLVYYPDENTLSSPVGDSDFTSGTDTYEANIEIGAGESVNVLLGLMKYATVRGRAWIDMNGNIEPLPGVEVILRDNDGHLLQTVTTNENGDYSFQKLLAGRYLISATVPEGRVIVESDDARLSEGSLISILTNVSGRSGTSEAQEVVMGTDLQQMDIGCVLPGTLGDFVWLDLNFNGMIDSDEGGIPGIVLHLMRNGEEIATTVSDQYGFYRFENLYPAAYTIHIDLSEDVMATRKIDGIPGITSILNADGNSDPVSVISNAPNYTADLGLFTVNDGVYPEGYGHGNTQDWTPLGSAD